MKKLYRSKDKKLAGVCGGVAEYFNVDPTLIRLGWVVMTVVTGFIPGVFAYFVTAVIVPAEPSEESSSKTSGQSSAGERRQAAT